jgi:ubiquinone/menaquinone biosynthesis C-methylase UbiE
MGYQLQMKSDQESGNKLRPLFEAEGGVRLVFSDKVADYVASRPDYPATLFEALKDLCPPAEGVTVADVGAGTGLLTHGLLKNGYRVIAVEINPEMRRASDFLLSGRDGYSSIEGSAESMPLDAGSVDLITAAQAFQWFEVEPTRTEFLRVLKDRGQVALIWNDRVFEDPLHMALDQVFEKFGGVKRAAMAAHRGRSGVSRFFGASRPKQFSWSHVQYLDEEGLLSLVFSRSYIPKRSTPDGRKVADRVGDIFNRFVAIGKVEVRYKTVLIFGRPI